MERKAAFTRKTEEPPIVINNQFLLNFETNFGTCSSHLNLIHKGTPTSLKANVSSRLSTKVNTKPKYSGLAQGSLLQTPTPLNISEVGISKVELTMPKLIALPRNSYLKNTDGSINETAIVTLRCTFCGRIALLTCYRCSAAYCFSECQRKDWPTHKLECIDHQIGNLKNSINNTVSTSSICRKWALKNPKPDILKIHKKEHKPLKNKRRSRKVKSSLSFHNLSKYLDYSYAHRYNSYK